MTLAPLFLALLLAATDTAADGFAAEPAEIEAYAAFEQRQFVKARERAAEILRGKPRSFVAQFVLGAVEHYGEGNLSRAIAYYGRARKTFEELHGAHPGEGKPWRWHAEILKELAWTSGEMDRRPEELSYLDAHDALYQPPMWAERAWPLMKLGRLAQARRMIELAIATGKPDQIDRAMTARCAIEYESENRKAAFEACMASADAERRDPQPGSIPFGNAAEAALGVLRFDLAERLILEGAQKRPQGGDNPWSQLSQLHLLEGRFSEAAQALQQAVMFRRHRPAYLHQQMRAETEAAAATFLLAADQIDLALRFTQRAMDRPDRGGLKSGQPDVAASGAALVHHVVARTAAEHAREAASAAPVSERPRLFARSARLDLEAFRAGRRSAALLAGHRHLVQTLRPYLGGGALVATFLVPDLVRLIGPGVTEAALDRARLAEDLPEAATYLDELGAETALGRGKLEAALALGRRALERLPAAEKLLAARAAAVGAEAAWRLARDRDAAALAITAFQRDPGVFRRLGLRLRVRLVHDGTEDAKAAVALLKGSPRLEPTPGSTLAVHVELAHACLRGPDGAILACGELAPGKSPAGPHPRRLVDAFHQQVFAPKVDLSQVDLVSLDGSTATPAGGTSEQTQRLLDELR